MAHSAELIKKTRDTFEPKYGRPLTDTEVDEIIDNMVAWANLLIEMYQKEEAEKRLSQAQ